MLYKTSYGQYDSMDCNNRSEFLSISMPPTASYMTSISYKNKLKYQFKKEREPIILLISLQMDN